MWQFGQAVEGIGEACRALDTPITGGNVSLYNETDGKAIYPTPVIGVVGLLEHADRVVSRAGVQVDRYFRYTRSSDGKIFVWLARKAGQGRGPGWSGLRFDIVRDMATSDNGTK